jgi:hypothetical protein
MGRFIYKTANMRKHTILSVSSFGVMLMLLLPIQISFSQIDGPTQNNQEQITSHGVYSWSSGKTTTKRVLTNPLYDDLVAADQQNVSAKAQFNNLEIFLIYGTTETDQRKYVTLSDALKDSMVKVKETGTVNNLQISNYSSEYIYINSGDIVKGGKQDRTIKYDIVIGPNMKDVNLASFCVERGRWSQRNSFENGTEDVSGFNSSEYTLSDANLKIAARYESSQSQVWTNVDAYQVNTEANINRDRKTKKEDTIVIKSKVSSTSLELTLENKELKKVNDEYKTALLQQLPDTKNAVGMAYYINGRLYNVDIYNNHQLFADLYNKLLDAAIAEAISIQKKPTDTLVTDVNTLKDLLKANAKVYVEEKVNELTTSKISENNANKSMVIFTTFDEEQKTWLRRNWIYKP